MTCVQEILIEDFSEKSFLLTIWNQPGLDILENTYWDILFLSVNSSFGVKLSTLRYTKWISYTPREDEVNNL